MPQISPTDYRESYRQDIMPTLSLDIILPDQFYDMTRTRQLPLSPEQRLLVAIINEAFHCFQLGGSSNKRAQRLSQEAYEWFMSEAADWPFYFRPICDQLSLSPEFIRRNLVIRSDFKKMRSSVGRTHYVS